MKVEITRPFYSSSIVLELPVANNLGWTLFMGKQKNKSSDPLWSYFPYKTMRKAQPELISAISHVAQEGGHLVVEAPNGFGKTITVLAGVLSAARKLKKRILYCCRTHQQMDRVIEELQAIRQKAGITGVSMRGRMQMCLNPDVTDNASTPHLAMELCRVLKHSRDCKYYTTLRDNPTMAANLAFQITKDPTTASEIVNLGESYTVCPYELLKDLLGLVDVTALSYNYLFEPNIRATLLRDLDESLDKYILVLDEAHNLPSIAVNLASETLTDRVALYCQNEAARNNLPRIQKFSHAVIQEFEHYRAITKTETHLSASAFLENIRRESGIGDLTEFLKRMKQKGEQIHKEQIARGQLPRSYVYRLAVFLSALYDSRIDPSFLHLFSYYFTRKKERRSRIDIISLDPRTITQPVLSQIHASISMSGTLTPLQAYIETIGLPASSDTHIAPSPFSSNQMRVIACQGVSTAMKYRSSSMFHHYVKRLKEAITATPGNVGIFSVSYKILNALLNAGLKESTSKPFFIEQSHLTSRENDRLVTQFRAAKKSSGGVLLGVLGGRNSEGTDFGGGDISTVIVVGVPYAPPNLQNERKIEYYEQQFPGRGREYAYHLPALKRASQAAGRAIRKLTDHGVIVLMDTRYTSSYCTAALPHWLVETMDIAPDQDGVLQNMIHDFYSNIF